MERRGGEASSIAPSADISQISIRIRHASSTGDGGGEGGGGEGGGGRNVANMH